MGINTGLCLVLDKSQKVWLWEVSCALLEYTQFSWAVLELRALMSLCDRSLLASAFVTDDSAHFPISVSAERWLCCRCLKMLQCAWCCMKVLKGNCALCQHIKVCPLAPSCDLSAPAERGYPRWMMKQSHTEEAGRMLLGI